jgi:hypothetical protein
MVEVEVGVEADTLLFLLTMPKVVLTFCVGVLCVYKLNKGSLPSLCFCHCDAVFPFQFGQGIIVLLPVTVSVTTRKSPLTHSVHSGCITAFWGELDIVTDCPVLLPCSSRGWIGTSHPNLLLSTCTTEQVEAT